MSGRYLFLSDDLALYRIGGDFSPCSVCSTLGER